MLGLENSDWPITESDVVLLEKEIQLGYTFIKKAEEMKQICEELREKEEEKEAATARSANSTARREKVRFIAGSES